MRNTAPSALCLLISQNNVVKGVICNRNQTILTDQAAVV
jgi:hypothetical protein